ncbi:MAG TPA: GNAT family N-acetyltransferase [Chthoniobacteraceae bacterium]|nr:GNAT family N-acetyltransferase [Chthoniobacteraceae bacterium]
MGTAPASTPLRARVASLHEARGLDAWRTSLEHLAKDARYYEVVADTLRHEFDCRCILVEDDAGAAQSAWPCFLVEQDLVATAPPILRALIARLRRIWPRLLRLRMLMIGCAAGEGALPARNSAASPEALRIVSKAALQFARDSGGWLVVWKDFPARQRVPMTPLLERFERVPSMPATRLPLGYSDFDEYLARRLSHASRKSLRRKLRGSGDAKLLRMTVTSRVDDVIEEVHALYLEVFDRSKLRFEKLSKAFLLGLAERMPDRVRFFLWHRDHQLVACSICFVHDGVLYDEYLGLDYRVALDLHLYFVTFRDVLSWALAQGLHTYASTPLNYEPKLRLGFDLAPLDLYVATTAPAWQPGLRWILPWISPTRGEPLLRRFRNAAELEA